MSIRAGDKSIVSTDLSSKNIYNSPEKTAPGGLLNRILSWVFQEKNSTTYSQPNKPATIVQQNKNLVWQIKDASRKGDVVSLAKILEGVSKETCKVLMNMSDAPLIACIKSNSLQCLQLLLKAGANPSHRNAKRKNFLHIAAYYGRSDLIDIFLKSIPKDVAKALMNSSDKDGNTPLLSSACSKSVRGAQLLLKAGANPSHRNAKRGNFLHYAAILGRHELIKVFLKSVPKDVAKSLINSSDKDGDTPLLSSACSKSVRGAQLLLKAGANPSHRNAKRENFLHVAANRGCPELIKVFLKSVSKDVTKALINSSDKDGDTPLLSSACSKSVRGAQLLLKAGANPSHRNAERKNFLHYAAILGRPELIKVFLKSVSKDLTKALVNSFDKDGNTPLLNCISPKSRNTKECVQFLLKAKANPLICNREGCFPYVEAVETDHTSTASLLAKKDPKQKGTFALLNLQIAFGSELYPILFGKKVNFPGSSPKFWSGYISSTLQKISIRKKILPHYTQKQCEELQQAFALSSAKNPSVEKIVQKIRQGKLVIVPAGWEEHAISLVFRDGYLIVCNRGEGCEDKNGKDRTFFICKISSNLMSNELLKRCLATEDVPARKGIKFFYKELPQALNGTEDDFCQRILSIAPKISKADTCGYTCMKAALRASLALITKDPNAARDIAKAWATKHRESALELFRKSPSPFDKAFRKETIDAMSKRLKKRKRSGASTLVS